MVLVEIIKVINVLEAYVSKLTRMLIFDCTVIKPIFSLNKSFTTLQAAKNPLSTSNLLQQHLTEYYIILHKYCVTLFVYH